MSEHATVRRVVLLGPPGAGKGTQARFIQNYRGLTAEPIVVSELLQSPAARKLIDAGLMVGDREDNDIKPAASHGWQTWCLAHEPGKSWAGLRDAVDFQLARR